MTEGIESNKKKLSTYSKRVYRDIVINKVGTEDNLIDIMPKSLSISKFDHCLDLTDICY